jgi:hypothetical protein
MTQNQRVLEYIKQHGAITVAECSKHLNIFHLPRRIKDLEERGIKIKRIDKKVLTASKKLTVITVYHLQKEVEQLKLFS